MKILAFVATVCLTFTSIDSRPSSIQDLSKEYCSLRHPIELRHCLQENGAGSAVEIFRRCVQTVKYLPKIEDMREFICRTRTEKEHEQFLNCFVPAMKEEAKIIHGFVDTAKNCLKSVSSHH